MHETYPVIALIPDLMAEVRFTEAMRAAGVEATVLSAADWQSALAPTDASPKVHFGLAVVDLTAPSAVAAVSTAVAAELPVLAYGPHVQADILGAAREAGATMVVPRGRFVREAGALVIGLLDGSPATGTTQT